MEILGNAHVGDIVMVKPYWSPHPGKIGIIVEMYDSGTVAVYVDNEICAYQFPYIEVIR